MHKDAIFNFKNDTRVEVKTISLDLSTSFVIPSINFRNPVINI